MKSKKEKEWSIDLNEAEIILVKRLDRIRIATNDILENLGLEKREWWERIVKKYKLDLTDRNYAVNKERTKIIRT